MKILEGRSQLDKAISELTGPLHPLGVNDRRGSATSDAIVRRRGTMILDRGHINVSNGITTARRKNSEASVASPIRSCSPTALNTLTYNMAVSVGVRFKYNL